MLFFQNFVFLMLFSILKTFTFFLLGQIFCNKKNARGGEGMNRN